MADMDVRKYADMVTLQMASEAFLSGADSESALLAALNEGNSANSVLPVIEINKFIAGDDKQFELIAHQDLSLMTPEASISGLQSGFSASLFYDAVRDEYTLSFRSTEFATTIRDAGDIEADLEIVQYGWAFSQIHSMEKFWESLSGGTPDSSGVINSSTGDIRIPDAVNLTNFQDAIAGGERINVTGYSLGGNLATAFSELHQDSVHQAFVFNGAGSGRPVSPDDLETVWSEYLSVFEDPASTIPFDDPESPYYGEPAPNGLATATAELLAAGQLDPARSIAYNPRHLHALAAIADKVVGAIATTAASIGDAVRIQQDFASRIVDIWSQDHLDSDGLETLVARSGIRYGTATPIWYENQPLAYWDTVFLSILPGREAEFGTGHAIALLQDSLSLMAAFESLDSRILESDLGQIFGFSSSEEHSSLEHALNSLARIFSLPALTQENFAATDDEFANIALRNNLHNLLNTIRTSTLFQSLEIKNPLPETPPNVSITVSNPETALAGADSSFGEFLALYYLSAFTLDVPDTSLENGLIALQGEIGADWSADRDLTETERAAGLAHFTTQFLKDRAEFLDSLMVANEFDRGYGQLARSTKFRDFSQQIVLDGDTRGYSAAGPGGDTPGDNDSDRARYVFGSDEADDLLSYASENDDHLYGMSGADTINGLDGDDYLEGGNDNDQLHGGADSDVLLGGKGNDILDGEAGNDYLIGGQGNDEFHWRTGGGEDTIGDYDTSEDRIFVNGTDLSLLSFTPIAPDSTFYRNASQPEISLQYDGGELIINIGSGLDSGQIFVQQYSPATGADFGIELGVFSGITPLPTDFLVTAVKETASDPDGIDTSAYDRYTEDADWETVAIRFNAAAVTTFVSEFSDPYQNIAFWGGPVDDHLSGDGLSNFLLGGNGADTIEGGGGRDYLAGGGGSDRLYGGDGDDDIFGSTFFAAIENYPGPDNPDGGSYSAENLYVLDQLFDGVGDKNTIDGGAGADNIHGGEYVDEISGGVGDDVIFGGTGEDNISGGADNDRIYGDSGLVPVTASNVFQYYKIGWADGDDAVGLYDDDIHGGAGDDVIWGELGNDTLRGGAGRDYLFGDREEIEGGRPAYGSTNSALDPIHHGDDRLYGGADTDLLYGLGGNDLLAGGAGTDYLYGGAGDDTYEYRTGDGRDAIGDTEGLHTLLFTGTTISDIQIVYQHGKVYVGGNLGLDGFQVEKADWGNVQIAINSPDSIVERSRFDTYYYTDTGELRLKIQGIDGITEAQRDEVFTVDNDDPATPRLVINSDVDTLEVAADNPASDTFPAYVALDLFGHPVNLSFHIAPDLIDEINYLGDTTLILAGAGDVAGTGGSEHIIGSSTADHLSGFGGNDYLMGLGGNDTLAGGSGDDTIIGGAGNDTISTGGQGFDTNIFAPGDGEDTIEVKHAARLSPRAPLGDISFEGLPAGDLLEFSFSYEFDSAQTVLAYTENDLLTLRPDDPGAEDESLLPYFTLGSQSDPTWIPTIRAGSESPGYLFGSFGADVILGNNVGQRINPGYGDDVVFAGTGDDSIVLNTMYMDKSFGGIGHKHIVGGLGNDTITAPLAQGLTYYYSVGHGHDTIQYDWSTTVDKNFGVTAVAPYDIGVISGTEELTFSPHGQDTLVFGEGIDFSDLRFLRSGSELLITVAAGSGSIQVSNFFVATEAPAPPLAPDFGDLTDGGPVVDSVESLYHLGLIPENPISKIRLGDGTQYDILPLLAEFLEHAETASPVTITGTAGNDVNLIGNSLSNDDIYGLDGDDTIVDAGGTNNIYGGDGDDTITLNGGVNYVEGGAGVDFIALHGGTNTVIGTSDTDYGYVTGGSNNIQLGDGADGLTILGGSNTIDMGAGNDDIRIYSNYGGDSTIQFGTGHGVDIYEINTNAGSSIVALEPGITREDLRFRLAFETEHWSYEGVPDYNGFIEISIPLSGDTLQLVAISLVNGYSEPSNGSAINELRFADGDVLSGTDLWNMLMTEPGEVITGTSASETITGTGNPDTIRGNAGDDTLYGLAGDDTFEVSGVDDGADLVDGGAGFDSLVGSDAADIITLRALTPAHSLERIDGVNGTYNFVSGTANDDVLDFSATELVNIAAIVGAAGNDTITGSLGNDLIVGGAGNDIIDGGLGNDIFLITGNTSGENRIAGGEGFDTILGSATPDTFVLSDLQPADSVERIDGGTDFFNFVSGTNTANTLNFLTTEFRNIIGIVAGAGDDTIVGTRGNELILGGEGDDFIMGVTGDDALWGGSGSDSYFFLPGDGTDTIQNTDTNPASFDSASFVFAAYDSLWFSQDADDLLIDVVGSNDQVRVQDWFASEDSKLDSVNANVGVLLKNQLDSLVTEMAAFDVPVGIGAVIPADTRTALEPALAAAWQLS